ncbi:DUF2955 domain-containing protein [Pseudomonas sp. JS3066]|jgi:hypothetical protein|uniref:DUF2955 domain-containing protein n=1 Tax=unclassified Pseudomonas TaxID=196821 RepID=UPI00129DFD80|nr:MULTISPECIES: DUF2955 domain-containing protein [unclassified Pseudomonas]MDH4652599.1 DUF2955 domain-containing protein [Pseudomonas sp. BN606]MRK19173.1 DUF2955 domain-containing protein [Pseudomonas sp. JG-B]WVK92070.1 DUF2955 domain-containing protein [Pseudomonas sp. JS3066]
MPTEHDPRSQRALRLASGTALGLAISFGLALPIPFLAPIFVLVLLTAGNRPLPLKAGPGLALVIMLSTGTGLLLIPLLRHAPASGVLLVALCLYLCFRYGLRGGNPLVAQFLVIGLTMISAAGTAEFALALTVIQALGKGVLLAVLVVSLSHMVFPEPTAPPAPAARPVLEDVEAAWVALRAALVVLPAFLLALIDPASYMPLIMKSVSLGQQVCGASARTAGRELLGSTLLGGVLAMLFWSALSLFPHLWMFFLWMLLFGLLLARKLYRLSPTAQTPGFWVNTLITLIILLGQSVQDSAAGKDVYTAFAVRMGLFIAVTLYACAAVYLIDRRRFRRQRRSTL